MGSELMLPRAHHSSLITHHSALRRYDAVFLDAQGTLLRARPSVSAIYARVCRRFGKRARHSEVAAALRELWAEVKPPPETHAAAYDTSDEATKQWWAGFNSRLFRRLGMEEQQEEFIEALWDVFGRPETWKLFPEVRRVLAELRARNYRLGMVSNWDSRLVSICESLGLDSHMDFILASASTGMEKPDSRIFEIALRRAGVPPERAIHVGDDYEADVLGAKGAGLDALLLDRAGSSPTSEPTIRSLEELLRILQ